MNSSPMEKTDKLSRNDCSTMKVQIKQNKRKEYKIKENKTEQKVV